IANEGSISIIDLTQPEKFSILGNPSSGKTRSELLAGLHTSALALSPNRRYVVAANAASDTLSVIDTKKDQIIETIWTRQSPGDLFGAGPNALIFDRSGSKLYVCNASQNAVGVIEFDPGRSKLMGLIPVGWFPGAITIDSRRERLCVANIKGFG